MLVVFGGLPGVGKTRLSRPLARRIGATLLRVDALEAAMWRAGIGRDQPTGLAAYVVANALADAQLGLGLPVVVDAVNPVEQARAGWRELANRYAVPLRVVEVVCSDPGEHRRRVDGRGHERDQPSLPTWRQVLDRDYEPWNEPRLTVDTADGDRLREVMAYVLHG